MEFINSWVEVDQVKTMIGQRTKLCSQRINFFKHLNQLLKSTSQAIFLSKYVFGTEIIHLPEGFNSHLESAPLAKLDQLESTYKDYISTIKDIENKFVRESLSIGYKKFLTAMKSQESIAAGQKNSVYNQKNFLNKLRINAEIIYMIES